MRAVNRVTGLKPDHGPPPALAEQGPGLRRVPMIRGKSDRVRPVQHVKRTAQVDFATPQHCGHARMSGLGRAIDFLHLCLAVGQVALSQIKDGEDRVALID